PDLFFLGSEFGIFFTIDAGKHWTKLQGSPTISFRDLAIQKRENDLIGASFGRGFYVLDDYSPLRHADAENLKDDQFHLFPVRRALWYVQADSLGRRFGFQGDSFYSADNPPYGATFTYYNGKEIKTAKQKRKDAESKLTESDIPTPSWEQLREEQLETAVTIVFMIRDSRGTLVSQLECPTSKGLHRITWNFRCPAIVSAGPAPLCAPGTYSVEPVLIQNGTTEALGDAVNFKVESIIDPALPINDRNEALEFLTLVADTTNAANALRSILSKHIEEIDSVQRVLRRSNRATEDLNSKANEIEKQLQEFDLKVSGDANKRYYAVDTEPTINSRLNGILYGASNSTHGPTQTHREQYEIATAQLAATSDELQEFIETEIVPLRESLDEAGLPWTQGRKLPQN
ncbi:MAG: hypothetical protein AAGA30_14295, partial [Planctomycetota bacterium]